MATQPTNLPVPSESPRDLKFNAGKIDEFVTSLVNTYTDRFGNEHYTIEGLRWLAQHAIAQYGWIPFGTFQGGATLTLPNQILKDEASGEYYRWDGSLPKTVPAGSTPDTAGGVGVGAWLSVGDSTLKAMLASSLGAGIVGYDSEETYAPGTVGDEIGPYAATGADNKYGRKDRARRHLSAIDFGDPATDIANSANLAIASLQAEHNPSSSSVIRGGTVELPRGSSPATTSIVINRNSSGQSSVSVKGDGQSTSIIDYGTITGTIDCIDGNGTGPAYGELSDFTILNAPRRAVSFAYFSRMTLKNLQSLNSKGDGFYFGVGFVSKMDKLTAIGSASSGFRFDSNYQHTSISMTSCYAQNNSGSGYQLGFMTYCNLTACASDDNAQYGYVISGANSTSDVAATNPLVLDGCGAESNGRSAIGVVTETSTSKINNVLIKGFFAYKNNLSNNGYPNLLHVTTAANGGSAVVSLEGCRSVPSGAGSTTPDVLVTGQNAVCRVKGDNDLPNGWQTSQGGYVDYDPITSVKSVVIPASTATAVCDVKSTQGHKVRYGGQVIVHASNLHPSSAVDRKTSTYILLISKSIGGGAEVGEIMKRGSVAPSGNVADNPSFTWSLSGDKLIATPATGVGGGTFWFEIDTVGQVVCY